MTPFVLAGLGSFGAGWRAETRHQHRGSLQGDVARGEVDRLFARLQRHAISAEGIAQLGLTEQLKAKTKFTSGGPVTDYLARGDFEIGIQQTNIMVGVPGTDYVGPLPGFLNKPCPSSVALLSSLEAAGRRARDDRVHDFAGGRTAAPQDPRGTGQAGSHLRQMIARCLCAEQAGTQVPPLFCVCRRPLPSGRIRLEVTR